MPSALSSLSSIDVSNVFVYVGDAVRWDYTPEVVSNRGLTCKTIAASIHSPTSFASLVTGHHPPKHGVDEFTNQIPTDVDRVFDLRGFQTRFVNSVRDQTSGTDPLFSVLDIDPPSIDDAFEGVEEPFFVVERGPGGHAPYGDFDGSAWEYFESRGNQSARRFQAEYTTSVGRDASQFTSRLEELADRDVLEDTLVVYTSDHGELLGERGLLGHNGPMHPALVEVPTVFIHPDLPSCRPSKGVFRHVDLFPTVLGALDNQAPPVDGRCIQRDGLASNGPSFYRSSLPTGSIPGCTGSLSYEGVWDSNGGHVFARTPTPERLVAIVGTALKSPKRAYYRANAPKAIRTYLERQRTYGTPSTSVTEAKTHLESIRRNGSGGQSISLSETQREQLEDLGYLS
ncbi:sulfatase-like hydrolase/transferase [Halopiger goleimassiliensis]|uniref:sulfatase-like hydrolase/transferase n=1 Tax=Halopiger goleimassiliensis TaxID=1293048 RepID=UPI0018A880A2|nr:sulfatase-like hydrolase/transferase [Halopiger goleimassiliensis]